METRTLGTWLRQDWTALVLPALLAEAENKFCKSRAALQAALRILPARGALRERHKVRTECKAQLADACGLRNCCTRVTALLHFCVLRSLFQ
jgi:hypothetical protein